MTFVDAVMDYIARMGQTILELARLFTLKDALDVAIVTMLLYGLVKLVRDTRASQLVKGIILLVALFLIAYYGELMMLYSILKSFLQSGLIIVVILYQPEIRNSLEHV